MKKKPFHSLRPLRSLGPHRHSVVVGMFHDIGVLLRCIYIVLSWPVMALSRHLLYYHRHHKWTRTRHAHAGLAFLMGMAILGVSFVISDLYHHTLWSMVVETVRAAGVCPIWEVVALVVGMKK